MTALDAAYQVLLESGKPLHAKEIARLVIEKKLWETTGSTPEATIDARISVDIRAHGAASRFRRAGGSIFEVNSDQLQLEAAPINGISTEASGKTSGIPSEKTLSFADAAERVLQESPSNTPMHYRAITEKALHMGLLKTDGRTPEATMYAQLLSEIDRQNRRGEPCRFTRHGRGMVGLSGWQEQGLAYQIDQHNREVRRRLHVRLKTMPPDRFEALVGTLLGKLGFEEVQVTRHSGDGGIDVRGTLVVGDVIRTRMAVQVKRWRQNVQSPVVQQVRGSLGAHEQGLIVTTSDFASGARSEAERPDATPVALMNGEQLVNLLVENDIGIHRATHDLIELGEDSEDI